MVSLRRQNAIDSFAIATIGLYQRHLSPHKGFFCAHRVLYGGESCSQYVKKSVARYGLMEALLLSRQRFADCKTAAGILKAEREKEEDSRRSPHQSECWGAIESSCDIVSCAGDCLDFGDCTLADGGSCSCGDCSFGDCGCGS